MATDSLVEVCFESTVPEAYLAEWKVKPGSKISQGTVLLLYDEKQPIRDDDNSMKNLKKMKATMVGTVIQLLKNEGECISRGCALLFMKGCSHPIVMKDMCAECGADLREIPKKQKLVASVAMVHSIPELVVSDEQAQILGKADEIRLLQSRKLVLLVDLDQTVIHTTNDDIPPNLKDVHHFQLHGFHSLWYHARIRPGTQQFLEKISKYFELHICSFGARSYAHTIARILDKDGRYFSHRILSRDECFNPNSKTANLRALFPCGDSLVCIIDDRADVWNFSPNLVQVKPYHFFQHTGDINAPPGLSKMEKDSDEHGCALKRIFGKKSLRTEKVSERTSNEKKEAESGSNNLQFKSVNFVDKEECIEKCKTVSSYVDCIDTAEVSCTKEVVVLPCDGQPSMCATEQGKRTKENEQSTNCIDSTPDPAQDDNSGSVVTKNNLVERHVQEDNEPNAFTDEERSDELVAKNPEEIHSLHQETSLLLSSGEQESDLVDIDDDDDDYLLYLSDILLSIHKTYYEMYDDMKSRNSDEIPDLKRIIPYVRKKVLEGVRIVFSGVIPTNLPIERSRAYYVAHTLGAEIQSHIVPLKKDKHLATTHVVAARLGTVKVNEAKKCRGIHIVTPDWLWCCADRWEKVNEQLFILNKDTAVDQKSVVSEKVIPVNVNVAEMELHQPAQSTTEPFPIYDPVTGKRINRIQPANNLSQNISKTEVLDQQNGSLHNQSRDTDSSGVNAKTVPANFATSINPLLSFSSEEIANMDQEVEDLLDSVDSDEEDNADATRKLFLGKTGQESVDESSSGDSLSGEHPRGWKTLSRKRKRSEKGLCLDEDSESDIERAKRRTCELDDSYRSNSTDQDSDDFENSVGSVDEEMAAAVEREFLGL